MRYVYIVRAGERHFKVGIAHNVAKRIASLQTSNAQAVELVTSRLVVDAGKVESSIHAALKDMRTPGGREWFELEPAQALELCVRLNDNREVNIADFVIERVRRQIESIIDKYEKNVEPLPAPVQAVKVTYRTVRAAANPSFEELLSRAWAVATGEQKISTSLLQRRLAIGYGKASRIIDELEHRGLISSWDGARPRSLLASEYK